MTVYNLSLPGRPFEAQELGATVQVYDSEITGDSAVTFKITGIERSLDDGGIKVQISVADDDGLDEDLRALLEQFRNKRDRVSPVDVILADGSTLAGLLSGSDLDGSKIGTGTLPGSAFADGSIDGSKITDGTITEAKHEDDSISDRVLAPCSVTVDNGALCDGAVTTDKIADDSITLGKLDPDLRDLLLNNQGAGGGDFGGTVAVKTMPDLEGGIVRGWAETDELTGIGTLQTTLTTAKPATLSALLPGQWAIFGAGFTAFLLTATLTEDGYLKVSGSGAGRVQLVYRVHQDDLRYADVHVNSTWNNTTQQWVQNAPGIPDNVGVLAQVNGFALAYHMRTFAIGGSTPQFWWQLGGSVDQDAGLAYFTNPHTTAGYFTDYMMGSLVSGTSAAVQSSHLLTLNLSFASASSTTLFELGNLRLQGIGVFPSANYRTINFPIMVESEAA